VGLKYDMASNLLMLSSLLKTQKCIAVESDTFISFYCDVPKGINSTEKFSALYQG
jgi:hypothetical protein